MSPDFRAPTFNIRAYAPDRSHLLPMHQKCATLPSDTATIFIVNDPLCLIMLALTAHVNNHPIGRLSCRYEPAHSLYGRDDVLLILLKVAGDLSIGGSLPPPALPRSSIGDQSLTTRHQATDASNAQKRPLQRQEILKRLSGRRLRLDMSLAQEAVPFSETFLANGAWVGHRSERGMSTQRGTWRVDDGKVCVVLEAGAQVCRQLYMEPSSNRVVFSDILGKSPEVFVVID
jgi:hypothetical protein